MASIVNRRKEGDQRTFKRRRGQCREAESVSERNSVDGENKGRAGRDDRCYPEDPCWKVALGIEEANFRLRREGGAKRRENKKASVGWRCERNKRY